jgi:hypothetical protein
VPVMGFGPGLNCANAAGAPSRRIAAVKIGANDAVGTIGLRCEQGIMWTFVRPEACLSRMTNR